MQLADGSWLGLASLYTSYFFNDARLGWHPAHAPGPGLIPRRLSSADVPNSSACLDDRLISRSLMTSWGFGERAAG
jgi:hypothetical protein